MKRKAIGALIIVVLLSVALFQTVPVMADSGELSRVKITPSNVALSMEDTVEFTATAYDANKAEIDSEDLVYAWDIVNGGGDIDADTADEAVCSFTAGDETGVYDETIEVMVEQDGITKYAYATVTVTDELDHVIITPSTLTLAAGDTKQFKARSYDDEDVEITAGIDYVWEAEDAGTIDEDTGSFTAGDETGTFEDAITVTASQDSSDNEATDTASVTVKESSIPTPRTFKFQQLFGMFAGCGNISDFENFLGGEFRIKVDEDVQTVEIIPGVVVSLIDDVLTITPNDSDADEEYTITDDTVIGFRDDSLAEGDKVIVVTTDDVVTMVMKIGSDLSGQLPPGLEKNNQDARVGKDDPQGWSRGGKTGWGNNMNGNNNQGQQNKD